MQISEENDYYKVWDKARLIQQSGLADFMHIFKAREEAVRIYGYAIPEHTALTAIKDFVKKLSLVELGAGLGYWAKLLSEMSVDISAYDKNPVGDTTSNTYPFKHSAPHYLVKKGDESMLFSDAWDCLMLIWPCYNSNFAQDALEAFQGDKLIYIGEWGGCTATEEFHEVLESGWTRERVDLPNWCSIHDDMFLCTRR